MGSSLDPSPLTHSWPLFERAQRFDLGCVFSWAGKQAIVPALDRPLLAARGIGLWDCDLTDGSLQWSEGVYDLFGLPRGKPVLRSEALTFYAEPSRAAMEKLRDYALRHRRGFTLDVELRPADGGIRWMRIVGAPVCAGSRPTRLQGFKRDVSAEYGIGVQG